SVFTIAVEFALQLIDFDEPAAHLAGWLVVGALGLFLLFRVIRRYWRTSSPSRVLATALDLGKRMRSFHRMRESAAPSPPPSFWQRHFRSRREQWTPGYGDRSAHDAETIAIWTGRFAKELSATLANLHKHDFIDQAEMTRLLAPLTPADIASLSMRLIELGCREVGHVSETGAIRSGASQRSIG
ncbi:MAG TPA: hypothetical protein VFW48_00405, partial [Solirubrobacterales bacterium]|nr:hypothetical protein [Solirubrobacterales bacterium]